MKNKNLNKKYLGEHLEKEIQAQNERWFNLTIRKRGLEVELATFGKPTKKETEEAEKLKEMKMEDVSEEQKEVLTKVNQFHEKTAMLKAIDKELQLANLYLELENQFKKDLKKNLI